MSFTQNELRPAELEDGKLREIERDMAWLAERQPSFVTVARPACGGDGSLEVLDGSTPAEMDTSIVRDAALRAPTKISVSTWPLHLEGAAGPIDALISMGTLSGRLSLADQPFLRKILVDDWERLGRPFQAFLKEQGLSSHLWLAAVRR